MQNKNILVVFTVLLALATLYTLSFNWVASGYEATADEYGAYVADSLESAEALGDMSYEEVAAQAAREFLRDSATAEIYPGF
jgi:F0F1-type ATP synthase membrane subunit b/b'